MWTGSEVAVVGHVNGSGKSIGNDTLLVYNPGTDQWRAIPWGLDGVRDGMTVAWTGNQLFIGGGTRSGTPLRDAAHVDLGTGAWDRVPDAPIGFTGNTRYAELWTGSTVLTLEGDNARPVALQPHHQHLADRAPLTGRRPPQGDILGVGGITTTRR